MDYLGIRYLTCLLCWVTPLGNYFRGALGFESARILSACRIDKCLPTYCSEVKSRHFEHLRATFSTMPTSNI
ncbi:hypothetical protein F4861DRAFT_520291 [Xylaria intraflava]|nr:hypothetical protein F4861DRAFT_520291 [Xylaria intraflava]